MGRPCGGPWYRPWQCEGGQFSFSIFKTYGTHALIRKLQMEIK